jgi:glycine/D-amino acid oxidase-like deaminating enzyme
LPPVPDPDVALDDFSVDPVLFEERLWPLLANRVPDFSSIKLKNFWAGHYDYNTFDQNAIVGPHPVVGNFLLANGFSGHGLQQAPAVGRGISEYIAYGEYRSLDLAPLAYGRLTRNKPLTEFNVI